MELLEKQIEDIIYNAPWLLDERFQVPNVKGKGGGLSGRQINIGKNGINRYIDLMFKDTRDNRPVIVELKKGEISRENIAQILEYRALVVSLEDDVKLEWQEEFGQNYYCPKLILIGTSAPDEVKISANLAGVEIRTLSGLEKLTVDFGEVYEIGQKLQSWNDFLKSGNRVLHERSEWVEKIFKMLKEVVDSFDNDDITMPKKMYETSEKDAWIVNEKIPFLNIPIWYKDILLCGIYEYFDDELAFSETKVYVDFNIDLIKEEENEAVISLREELVKKVLLDKGYEVICFENGCATITLERKLLENNNSFKKKYIQVISDAIYLYNEIEKNFGENEQ